ncbi:MAG: UDP-glucose 4-epimerase GalE [Paracoccaceae bacterium]
MAKKILLTGGAGFIGSHTYVALVKVGYDVTILDNFENARRDIPDRLKQITGCPTQVIDCDVRDAAVVSDIMAQEKFDAVVHFAARKSVGEAQADPAGYYQSNVIGLINVVQAMQTHGVKALVFSSSAAVYGNTDQVPIPEDTPLVPIGVYAETKKAGEIFLQSVAAADPDFTLGILRYFNPVGAHASGLIGEDSSQPPTNLVPMISRVARGELPKLCIFGGDFPTVDGTGVRDYIHVQDLARGHVLSLDALLENKQSHLVNLGTGQGHSVLEVLHAYGAVLGRAVPYEITERREGDAAISFASVSRAREILGFESRQGLDEMCASNWAFSDPAGASVEALNQK